MNRKNQPGFLLIVLLALMLSAACADDGAKGPENGDGDTGSSGSWDTSSDEDTGTGPESFVVEQLCPMEERVGGFNFTLADDRQETIFSGAIRDGITPENIPEVAQTSGGCKLLTPRSLFCDPPCTSVDVVCGEEGACIPAPVVHDVGTVTVSGLNTELSMTAIMGSYNQRVSDPYPAYNEGATLTLSTSGGDYSPFSMTAQGIAPLTTTQTVVAVDSGQPVSVTWEAGSGATDAYVHIRLVVNGHGPVNTGTIECEAPDTGAFTIPADIATALVNLGLSGFPQVDVTRISGSSTTIEPGCVDLKVGSSVTLEVEVEGMISCNDDEDCPVGQTCSDMYMICE